MRILIAEDDAVTRYMLQSALVEWGYEVTSARDGNEAWTILQRADAPLLAILDWTMPGLDGIDVCRRVRQESAAPYVYLLVLTARADKHDIVEAMQAGADDYVSKPFDNRELQVRLRAAQRIMELQETLRVQATRDALTGVWNRRMILELLHKNLGRAVREGTAVGVIMLDLDHFKRLNDTYGHLAGDEILCQVTSRVRTGLREYDTVGRYGGEEFLIVLPGCEPPQALQVAERVRECMVAAPVTIGTTTIPVTVSCGVAGVHKRHHLDVNALLQLADAALYRAKQAGRNRVECALTGPEMA